MENNIERRHFLKSLLAVPALTSGDLLGVAPEENPGRSHLKTSLNAFSFNEPLRAGTMTLDDLLDYCAQYNFDAVDITGYYFPKYPQVPTDEYIYHIKRKAHLLGLGISGTGIRNDFTNPDASKRKQDIQLTKNWIECAAKLGAPVLRIFAGTLIPKEYTWQQIAEWMVSDIRECVAYGQKHGVIVAIQNHNDFIKTAGEAIKLIKMVDREWFGLILDTGSYRQGDPYEQIAKTAPYAVNWQVKENIFVEGKEQKTDLGKLFKVIKASGYRGYLPLETLGKGDPKEKAARFIEEVRSAMGA
ncbi:MAG: sugar phosphate isomerase/epimerase [Cytophagaceae bacterium]|nr:sugar phosphate isomerase/epimerase [Cytophagaceae bacterium]